MKHDCEARKFRKKVYEIPAHFVRKDLPKSHESGNKASRREYTVSKKHDSWRPYLDTCCRASLLLLLYFNLHVFLISTLR